MNRMKKMDEEFGKLIGIIREAVKQITDEYFQLPVCGSDSLYRERVYCYELYHQMRCIWDDFPFSLGGEVDKAGHPYYKHSHTKMRNRISLYMSLETWKGIWL
mgnify:CR=1 FL=1